MAIGGKVGTRHTSCPPTHVTTAVRAARRRTVTRIPMTEVCSVDHGCPSTCMHYCGIYAVCDCELKLVTLHTRTTTCNANCISHCYMCCVVYNQ